MKLWKSFHRQKMGVRPHQIIFEKENTENTYITWEDKMKPRIDVDDGVTMEEYRAMAARWEEMLSLAEEIVWRNYLNPKATISCLRWTPSPTSDPSRGTIMWAMCPMAMSIGTRNTGPTR